MTFPLAYLYSVVLLLLVRPILGVETSSRWACVVGDSVALLVMDAAVLALLSILGTPGTAVIPACIILVASAVLGTCAALHAAEAPSAGRSYLLSVLLLSVTPVVTWLGLSEVAHVRIDWLLALSPFGAASASVIPGSAPGVAEAGAVWMTLLAIVSLAWLVSKTTLRKARNSKGLGVLSVLLLSMVLSDKAIAQETGSVARLELGVNGVIIAGGWNPARLRVQGLTEPTRAALDVDGHVRHEILLEPDGTCEFLMLIPQEQPVIALTIGEGQSATSASIALARLQTVPAGAWPGLIVTSDDAEAVMPSGLIERAPGHKFLTVTLEDLKRLPPAYLAQFRVVILQTADAQGLARDDFVRLTEWLASRTLAIDPGSKVRRDWPGLRDLKFETVHGYDVLNAELLDLLPSSRVRLVDPGVAFFGDVSIWDVRLRGTILLSCSVLLVVGTAFVLLMQMRVNRPAMVVMSHVVVVTVLLAVACGVIWRVRGHPVVTHVLLQERVQGSPVVLETRLTQLSGPEGMTCEVGSDSRTGIVPVHFSETQRRVSALSLRDFAGGMPREASVRLAGGAQVLMAELTRLVAARDVKTLSESRWPTETGSEGQPGVDTWVVVSVDEETTVEYLKERSRGLLDERFLRWWSARGRQLGAWRMCVNTESDPATGELTVRVQATR